MTTFINSTFDYLSSISYTKPNSVISFIDLQYFSFLIRSDPSVNYSVVKVFMHCLSIFFLSSKISRILSSFESKSLFLIVLASSFSSSTLTFLANELASCPPNLESPLACLFFLSLSNMLN